MGMGDFEGGGGRGEENTGAQNHDELKVLFTVYSEILFDHNWELSMNLISIDTYQCIKCYRRYIT